MKTLHKYDFDQGIARFIFQKVNQSPREVNTAPPNDPERVNLVKSDLEEYSASLETQLMETFRDAYQYSYANLDPGSSYTKDKWVESDYDMLTLQGMDIYGDSGFGYFSNMNIENAPGEYDILYPDGETARISRFALVKLYRGTLQSGGGDSMYVLITKNGYLYEREETPSGIPDRLGLVPDYRVEKNTDGSLYLKKLTDEELKMGQQLWDNS